MEQVQELIIAESAPETAPSVFIEANTIESDLFDIKQTHIIPVFVKDNEPVISHAEFVETTQKAVKSVFNSEIISAPSIRLSHPIKGRIPEAKYKPAGDLEEWEKTLYYERMAFVIEVPSISDNIGDNPVSLTIGGVKAYNLDNLYNRKGTDEHFKVFIGFQNKVCTNLCVWTDGFVSDLKVKNVKQLYLAIESLIRSYDAICHLTALQDLNNFSLSEEQFAHLIGRCRMYKYLPSEVRQSIPELLFGDSQINTVVKDYYRNQSFCKMQDGSINLWRLYNLFTEANKSTYIDQFIDRSINAFTFVDFIRSSLKRDQPNWYIN